MGRGRLRSADGRGRPARRTGGEPALRRHPAELQAGVDALTSEPEHPDPDLGFTQQPDAAERRRLTLWRLLAEYPALLAAAAVLVVFIAVITQVGPKLTEIAINRGMVGKGDLGVVALMAALYLVSVVLTALSQRWQVK